MLIYGPREIEKMIKTRYKVSFFVILIFLILTNFCLGRVEYWNFFYTFTCGFTSIWLADIYDLSNKLMIKKINLGLDQIEK